MQTEIKSFTVAGGAAYLASRYVFDATQRKSILYGIAGGLVIVALLQLKVKVPGVAVPYVDRNNSPVGTPEVDNSKANSTPETLVPLSFHTGDALENSVASQLSNDAVTDWDIAWGDNPYKAQQPTIRGV